MRLLRLLLSCAVLGVLAWTGWWYAVALGQEKALAAWFDERARAGWQAEHGEIRLTGFPFRLARELPDVRLADPGAGWAWAAPFLRIESGPVNPTRFDVTWPDSQSFAVPGEHTEIGSRALATRLHVRPESALRLVEARIDAAALEIAARSGWRAGAAVLESRVTARVNDPGYDVALRAERVELPAPLIERIDPLGVAGREVERLTLDGAAVFDRPLDRRLIEQGRLGLVEATVRQAGLAWGEVRLTLSGSVRVDAQGFPVGSLDVEARQWRELLAMARRSGALGPDMAGMVEAALGLVASLGGDRDRLDATLRFDGGQVWLGPVSLGQAPRLAPPKG